MRTSCGGLMNDRHLKLWRTMVQMYSWQRQTPMWVNIKDSFKQLFLIQDSKIRHHVLWFWNRRVQEAGLKIWLKLRVLHKLQSQPRDLSAHCLQWLKGLPHTGKHEIHGLRVENYDSGISRFCASIWHTVKFRLKVRVNWGWTDTLYLCLFVPLCSFSSPCFVLN